MAPLARQHQMPDDPAPRILAYESKPVSIWLRSSVLWSGMSLLLAAGCLPLSVGLAHEAEYWLNSWFSPGDSMRYSEWAGFALAAVMSVAGCLAAILARRALRHEPSSKLTAHAAGAGLWINVGALGLNVFIVTVLGGKW
jgi:hypothetical protein